ncbi:MAG: serine--tRNA ligase [Patescibacteria group bacterium]|jgi:seryl-tRNA synthetase
MLDIKFIRDNANLVQQAAKQKHITIDLPKLLDLDEDRRKMQKRIDDLKAAQGQANNEMATASDEQKQAKLMLLRKLSAEVKDLERIFSGIEQQFRTQLLTIPNIPDAKVPIGDNESANVELKKIGTIPQFDFELKDHLTLGKTLDIIDTERGVKVTGNRGYYLKGAGAQLELALMNYGLDFLRQRGFTQFVTPLMAYDEFFFGTGHFPWMKDETFKAVDKEKAQNLIGSAEVTLCAYHANETLKVTELPKKYTAWTPCFRTEVGSYGKDTKGLYRLRQFNKVEQVVLCKNDNDAAWQLFEEIIKNAEDFLTSLNLPYRVMELCTGEMGAGQRYKRDIETWMPSRSLYSETHSCSWLGDFQARRLNLRYRDEFGKVQFCQTLNNTLVASPRLLIPLLEMNQQADGSIAIPTVLQSYMQGKQLIKQP